MHVNVNVQVHSHSSPRHTSFGHESSPIGEGLEPREQYAGHKQLATEQHKLLHALVNQYADGREHHRL